MEVWKDILKFEGKYQVSNTGKIKSLDSRDNWGRVRRGKVLLPQTDKYGYSRVRISVNNKKFTLKIHREVAIAFIDNINNKPQVNHIDGDKRSNSVTNLEWVTNSENQKHAIDNNLKEIKTGKNACNFKSSILVYDLQMQFLYTLNGNKEIKSNGFDYRLVSAVVNGKRHHHKNHIFKRYLIPIQ